VRPAADGGAAVAHGDESADHVSPRRRAVAHRAPWGGDQRRSYARPAPEPRVDARRRE